MVGVARTSRASKASLGVMTDPPRPLSGSHKISRKRERERERRGERKLHSSATDAPPPPNQAAFRALGEIGSLACFSRSCWQHSSICVIISSPRNKGGNRFPWIKLSRPISAAELSMGRPVSGVTQPEAPLQVMRLCSSHPNSPAVLGIAVGSSLSLKTQGGRIGSGPPHAEDVGFLARGGQ